jgi:hypothetical protein
MPSLQRILAENVIINFCGVIVYGALAEWLGSGLQNRVHRFNSGRCLQDYLDECLRILTAPVLATSVELQSYRS